MPELPDVEVYVAALRERLTGTRLNRVAIRGPFLLRSVEPPVESTHGKLVRGVRRVGKRVAILLEDDFWLAIHLKIAGRLHWRKTAALTSKNALAVFEFDGGTLLLTEAGSQRRASLHAGRGDAGLQSLDAGGLEPLECSLDDFSARLTAANHTLKRALADPRLFSGIGNAYSDEILFDARLSPVKLTSKLEPQEIQRLYHSVRGVLSDWIARLTHNTRGSFPEKVTAFHEEMAVHGRYGLACRRCGAKIQRIRYASNETNYCAACQTGGRLLADRALSRLLREDWPRSLDELEELKRAPIPAASAGPAE